MLPQTLQQLARRAKSLYDQRLRHELESKHRHAFVAIEPDSGEYFLGSTMHEAMMAARSAHPDRLFHVMRIGHDAAVHIGRAEL